MPSGFFFRSTNYRIIGRIAYTLGKGIYFHFRICYANLATTKKGKEYTNSRDKMTLQVTELVEVTFRQFQGIV